VRENRVFTTSKKHSITDSLPVHADSLPRLFGVPSVCSKSRCRGRVARCRGRVIRDNTRSRGQPAPTFRGAVRVQ